MLSLADVKAARERIQAHVHKTPVMRSQILDELTGAELHFKCEHLQKAGAFKSRGAVNALLSLPAEKLRHGVATHSSGNHGAALARAARIKGVPAYIVVPESANAVKKAAILHYGGKIVESESTLTSREKTLSEVVRETGACFIHPYDSETIISGQGTAALELIEQVPGLDALIVPVGGGGLLSGCATAVFPNIKIYGAEPEQADDAFRSFTTGTLVESHEPRTICDGLLTTLGKKNFEIIRAKVTDILLVSESEVVEAMLLLWTRMKQLVEPSSAVTLAAVLREDRLFRGKRIGLILTGGNVDPALMAGQLSNSRQSG